jgi:hypothetical protein
LNYILKGSIREDIYTGTEASFRRVRKVGLSNVTREIRIVVSVEATSASPRVKRRQLLHITHDSFDYTLNPVDRGLVEVGACLW